MQSLSVILQLAGAVALLLFGLGLIGGAVDRALRLRCGAGAMHFPYD